MNWFNLSLILTGVALNAAAQLCLKQGMNLIGGVSLTTTGIADMLLKAFTNMPILLGILLYFISFVVWLLVLSRVEVTVAYPMLSIGYIIAAVVGYFCLGETMGAWKIAGTMTICLGTAMMFKA